MFEENENDINQNLNTEFYKKLNQQIVQKDKLIKMLQKHIEKLKDGMSIESGSEDQGELGQKVENLERENEDLSSHVEKLESKVDDYEKITSELEELKARLDSPADEEDIRKIDFLNKQLSDKDNEINAFIEKVEKLEFKISTQQNEMLDVQKKLNGSDSFKEKSDNLQIEIDELNKRIELMEVELGNRDRKIKELTAELDDLDAKGETGIDQEAVAKYEMSIKSLESEMDTIRSDARLEVDNLKRELQSATEKLKEEIKKRAALTEKTIGDTDVTEFEEKLNNALSEVQEYKDLLAASEYEFKEYRDKSATFSGSAADYTDALNQKITALEKEITDEKEKSLQLQKEKEDFSLQLDKIRAIKPETETRSSELKILESKYSELLADFEGQKGKTKAVFDEKVLLEKKLKKAQESHPAEVIPVDRIDEMKHLIEYFEKNAPEWEKKDMDLICAVLSEIGLSVIETVGVEYDPDIHEMVSSVKSSTFPEGVILNELSRGYKYRNEVIKKAEVSVVKNTLECSNCLKTVKSEDKFCSNCGNRVDMMLAAIGEEEELEKAALIFFKIARSYYYGGDYPATLSRIEESLKIDPDNEDAIKLKGEVYEKLGNFEKALECSQKVYDMAPDVKNENKLKGIRAKLAILNSIKDLDI